MGQEQTKQRQQIADNYTIVRTLSPGEFLVKRKKKGDELLLRILTFYLQEEMNGYIRILEKRKKIKNPHLLELVEHTKISQQNMCSSTFKIRTVVEYPFKTVKDEILERSAPVNQRFFNEDELWSILYSCCHALYSLYINKFYHECLNVDQIFIDTGGLVKIADSILVSTTKNYLVLMNESTSESQSRYISPELANLVQDNNFYFYEKEKSDVFILAMIILEIGNLSAVSYYNCNTRKFNFEAYISAIGQLRSRYSQQFCEILEKMLTIDFKARPRLEEIIESIEQRTVYTGSSGNTSFLSNQLYDKRTRDSKQSLVPNQSDKKQPFSWEKQPPTEYIFNAHPSQASDANLKKEVPMLYKEELSFNKELLQAPLPSKVEQNTNAPSLTLNAFSIPPLTSYSSQNIELSPSKRYGPKEQERPFRGDLKLQTWSFDAIIKDIQRRNNETNKSYTPYQQLVGLTTNKKDIMTTIPFASKESSNPVQKPNISVRFSSGLPSNSSSLAHSIPAGAGNGVIRQKDPQIIQQQSMEIKMFSEAKFGQIQLEANKVNGFEGGSPLREKQAAISNLSTQNKPEKEFMYPIAVQSVSIDKVARSIGSSSPDLKQTAAADPQFIIEDTPHGRYEGFVSNGKRNGVGRLAYTDGGYYQGKWKDGHMDGYGKLYYQNGSVAYQGHWAFSQFNGQGRIYNDEPDQSHKNDSIDYLNLADIGQKWTVYEGGFLDDEKSGKGTIYFVNGEKFSGTFVKDKIEGQGFFYKRDGDIVQGIWRDSHFWGTTS